jgi:hypothetical protein
MTGPNDINLDVYFMCQDATVMSDLNRDVIESLRNLALKYSVNMMVQTPKRVTSSGDVLTELVSVTHSTEQLSEVLAIMSTPDLKRPVTLSVLKSRSLEVGPTVREWDGQSE